jgi:hypothetical protein
MTVVIQFGSVVMMGSERLPVAGKRKTSDDGAFSDQLLLDGRHVIMGSTRSGHTETYDCMGTEAQYLALKALMGQQLTLTVSGTPAGTLTYTKCQIKPPIEKEETDNPNDYYWKVTFVQDTSI